MLTTLPTGMGVPLGQVLETVLLRKKPVVWLARVVLCCQVLNAVVPVFTDWRGKFEY